MGQGAPGSFIEPCEINFFLEETAGSNRSIQDGRQRRKHRAQFVVLTARRRLAVAKEEHVVRNETVGLPRHDVSSSLARKRAILRAVVLPWSRKGSNALTAFSAC